jgi:pimeloyl-ACP methyl ester carboxylesterase
MLKAAVGGGVVLGAVAGLVGLTGRYRRDLNQAQERLDAVERRVVDTEFGAQEYAEDGTGLPVLVSHGIFHGCDGGLLSVDDLTEDRRVIVPSRFGYLGSALPADATGTTQADAFAAVLDHLNLAAVDVVAISAGTSAAIQLALRHPHRVNHLVISSGNFPGSTTAQAPPEWATVFYSDRAMWALKTLARPMFANLMGIPTGFPQNPHQALVVDKMLASIFPVDPRRAGAIFDAYVTNPEITSYPLETLQVPTLIIHAKDDPLASHEAAVNASKRIPNAVLISLESGGHLQLGQTQRVSAEIDSFLASPTPT